MKNYLISLLKDENTVIIPGLGALTMVNRAKNELMFMSFMKHNDGTLMKFIASKEGIDEDAAKLKIETFVGEVTTAINSGKVYQLDGIGAFSNDVSGDIQFSQEEGFSETTTETPKVEEISEPISQKEEELIEKITEKEEVVEPPKEEKTPEVVNEIIETPIVVPPVEVQENVVVEPIQQEEPKVVVATQEEQWNDDLDLPPLNYEPERPKQPILEKVKKDPLAPHKKRSLLVLIIGLVIFSGAALFGFYKTEIINKIPFLASFKGKSEVVFTTNESTDKVEDASEEQVQNSEDETVEIEEESTENEAIIEETKVAETKMPETKTKAPIIAGNLSVDKSLPIQVIVGSFGVEENANRLVEKLHSLGFAAEVIGVYGGLHTVSAASFNSMDEYQANSAELQKLGNHWVKK